MVRKLCLQVEWEECLQGWECKMSEYDPNGDLNEKIMYCSDGHPEFLDPKLMVEFITHLKKNPNAPIGVNRMIYHNLLSRQVDELTAIYVEFCR